MTGILEGIRVADFSRVLAGPLATTMLADLGAEVIKVERPGHGDDTRHWGPPWSAYTSSYFECANRSKKSVELDLSDPRERELAQQLAASADVVVENFRDGVMGAKGLGHEQVSQINPSVVYCSITGFGSAAGASLAGYDFLVQALGGLMSITGEPQGPPMKVGVALVDVIASKDAFAGILAALFERERSGLGQLVEVNLLSSLLGSLANQASAFLATEESPERLGNAHPSIAPYETLLCSDGEMAVCCGNDRQFAALTTVIGASQLAQDSRFSTNRERVQNRRALVDVLEGHLKLRPVAHWVGQLTEAGVPAGEVGDIATGFALAEELGLAPRVPVGDGGIDQVRHPVTYSRTPVDRYARPPRLGEHTSELGDIINSTKRKL